MIKFFLKTRYIFLALSILSSSYFIAANIDFTVKNAKINWEQKEIVSLDYALVVHLKELESNPAIDAADHIPEKVEVTGKIIGIRKTRSGRNTLHFLSSSPAEWYIIHLHVKEKTTNSIFPNVEGLICYSEDKEFVASLKKGMIITVEGKLKSGHFNEFYFLELFIEKVLEVK